MTDRPARMTDEQIMAHINELETEERHLRSRLGEGAISVEDEQARLAAIEVELDRSWDLLRQRRAKASAHQNPDDAQYRPAATVEGYES
jgi:uncharacterized protein DUF2630